MAFAVALPGWFATHFDRMRDFTHFARAGAVIATSPSGTVKRSNLTRTLFGPVAWRMNDEEFARLRRGMSLLAQIYFAAGADCVLPATLADHPMGASRFAPDQRPDARAIDDFLRATLPTPNMVTLNSSHPQGGNPMSDDPSLGVVDSRFKVHGSDNLFVTDASVFPTSIRINPQLTIMAFADYAWRNAIAEGAGR
jgi:choline dehydrogenase-like flavoprotein